MTANDNSNVFMLRNFENNILLTLEEFVKMVRDGDIYSIVIAAQNKKDNDTSTAIFMGDGASVYTMVGLLSSISNQLITRGLENKPIGMSDGSISYGE